MFEFHADRKTYFRHQKENAQRYVIPFIEAQQALPKLARVLEIGCAEGGVLAAFVAHGCYGVGVELDGQRLAMANDFLSEEVAAEKVKLINKNIYDFDFQQEAGDKFDLIVLKDVIEHIHDQSRLLSRMKDMLAPSGRIFFGFPPWQMPFGGHQQICQNKWAAKLPYYHLLPKPMYVWLLRQFGESEDMIEALVEIKETGISLEQFERMLRAADYTFLRKTHFLINPIYQYKFGWQPREQFALITHLPYIRNFLTTCGYYLVR